MSGGVDSSVAAALLLKQGYDVVGIFMHFWSETTDGQVRDNICCSLEAQEDARRVCQKLGIPFYTMNMSAPFKKKIVDSFISCYKKGQTPNPCVNCNKFIKFGEFIRKAKALGCEYVATGHYANIQRDKRDKLFSKTVKKMGSTRNSRFVLLKSKDSKKDQTYFLHRLNQSQLAHILFPVGGYTKDQVRKLAAQYDLPTAGKRESQEVCFIPDNNLDNFLRKYITFSVGPIRDIATGEKIGSHSGLPVFTIGQRKGIGLPGGPWYVCRLDKKNNTLWVTKNEQDLFSRELTVKNVNWIAGKISKLPIKIKCRIRYGALDAIATIVKKNVNKYLIKFASPQRAVTPGQYAVFYSGRECLGGGEIV